MIERDFDGIKTHRHLPKSRKERRFHIPAEIVPASSVLYRQTIPVIDVIERDISIIAAVDTLTALPEFILLD